VSALERTAEARQGGALSRHEQMFPHPSAQLYHSSVLLAPPMRDEFKRTLRGRLTFLANDGEGSSRRGELPMS